MAERWGHDVTNDGETNCTLQLAFWKAELWIAAALFYKQKMSNT